MADIASLAQISSSAYSSSSSSRMLVRRPAMRMFLTTMVRSGINQAVIFHFDVYPDIPQPALKKFGVFGTIQVADRN